MREDVYDVRLAIDDGTRLDPTIARVHFVGNTALSEEACEKLDGWWQQAYDDAAAAGINLLPNAYHDSTQMDIREFERTIRLNV